MNTNEEKMTLAQITQKMEATLKEIHKLSNLIKGARLMRDATIKEMPAAKFHLLDIFTLVIAPFEKALDKLHTELSNSSRKDK